MHAKVRQSPRWALSVDSDLGLQSAHTIVTHGPSSHTQELLAGFILVWSSLTERPRAAKHPAALGLQFLSRWGPALWCSGCHLATLVAGCELAGPALCVCMLPRSGSVGPGAFWAHGDAVRLASQKHLLPPSDIPPAPP